MLITFNAVFSYFKGYDLIPPDKHQQLILIYGLIGFVLATVWFIYNFLINYGLPPYGDAGQYYAIAQHFNSIDDALTYQGLRTFGFPLFLYLIKILTDWSGISLVTAGTVLLFLLHTITCYLFFLTATKVFKRSGYALHPIALLLLLIQPGLVSHTSVLLTDTFSANLWMIAYILFARSTISAGIACGITLCWLVFSRPFSIVALTLFIIPLLVIYRKELPRHVLATIITIFILLTPKVMQCYSSFGSICLQEPRFAYSNAVQSMEFGLGSSRVYYSRYSQNDQGHKGLVIVPDNFMIEQWRNGCGITKFTTSTQIAECLLSKPFTLPVYFFKKTVGLFDQIYLHPYAVDTTTPGERAVMRAFGAIAFIGFIFTIFLTYRYLRQQKIDEAVLFFIPISVILSQIPLHIEFRYSFSALPASLIALVWIAQQQFCLPNKKGNSAFIIIVLVALVAFYVQTYQWDLNDQTLAILNQLRK